MVEEPLFAIRSSLGQRRTANDERPLTNDMFLNHIWLIPLFPAFGAAMMFFFGRRLQKATVNAVCVGVVVLAFLFACFTVVEYTHFAQGTGRPFEKIVYTWL